MPMFSACNSTGDLPLMQLMARTSSYMMSPNSVCRMNSRPLRRISVQSLVCRMCRAIGRPSKLLRSMWA